MSTNDFDARLAEVQAEVQAALDKKQALYAEAVAKIQSLVDTFDVPASAIKFAEEPAKPTKTSKIRRGVVPPKYKNPDGEQTWSGRGAKPQWFKEALEAGFKEEDLLIK